MIISNKVKQEYLFKFLNAVKNIGYKTETYNILDINSLDSFESDNVEFDIISKDEDSAFTINLDFDNILWHLTADSAHFIIGSPKILDLDSESLEKQLKLIVNALL